LISSDFNEHVGSERREYERKHGGYGFERNEKEKKEKKFWISHHRISLQCSIHILGKGKSTI